MDEAYNYLLSLLDNDDYVVVGVSGGPDSMALLHLLITLSKEKKINIICAHINHNVRIESEQEKIFVEKYCNDNNVIFEYMKIDKFNKDNFNENEARIIRYNFFKELIKKYKAKLLLTAHHGDDLIETILMRLVRGSTIKGYAGFEKCSHMDNYKIVKPLIYYTKDEILKYLNLNNISYVIDKSNLNNEYTRNRYRHNVLPFLKKEDINVNKRFLKYSETLLEYSNYIDKVALTNMKEIINGNKLDIIKYKKLDNLIGKRIISFILETIYKESITLINDIHISLINDLIYNDMPNKKLQLPNNVIAMKNYDYVSFEEQKNDIEDYELLLDKDVELPNNRKIIYLKEEQSNSNYVCRLNSKEITLPLYVRNKKDGDKICVKGLHGTKKIKDIYINEKIAIKDRPKWPIVVDKNGIIVWIPGLKKSKYNKTINEKYDIILRYI